MNMLVASLGLVIVGLATALAIRSRQYRKSRLAHQTCSEMAKRMASALEIYAVNDQDDDRFGTGEALKAIVEEIVRLQRQKTEVPPHFATLLSAINGWFYRHAQKIYGRAILSHR